MADRLAYMTEKNVYILNVPTGSYAGMRRSHHSSGI